MNALLKNTLTTILLSLGAAPAFAQNYDSLISSWDKIILVDSYGGWSHFLNEFEIKKIDNELFLINRNNVTLNKINQSLLDTLFNSLKTKNETFEDPLKIFGKDSIWLINNAESLWISYLTKDEPNEIDSLAISVIKDYQKVKRLVWSIQGSVWTDDYPFTSISLIKNKDTLTIKSSGQYPFMMPWSIGEKLIYNSGIPMAIAEILPDSIKSNKSRLEGDKFNYVLIDKVYNSFIKEYRNYMHAKIRYPKQFSSLENQFMIVNARLAHLGSIEWGRFISAPCLELTLKSKLLPDNICFSVIYGRRVKLHSIKPIIKKEAVLVNRLVNNKIYQYTVKNQNTTGEIHFVNTKSLSAEAKRNFLRDLKDNGIKKSSFSGKFRHAIFYELTEIRHKSRSFSRWILLKDGTNVLWQVSGNFLMNLNDSLIEEQGYVCRVISNEEFEN